MADSSFASHFPIYSRNKQMETDKMSTASSVGADRRPLMQALVLERRTLFACTVLVGLCTFVWIAAVCTEQWVHIDGGDGTYMPKTNRYFYYGTSGLWQTCRHVWPPPSARLNLTNHVPAVQPTLVEMKAASKNNSGAPRNVTLQPIKPEKPDLTKVILYTKCTNYLSQDLENGTIKDPAYHVDVATSCTLVATQIIMTTVDYFKKNVKVVYPENAWHYYGVSWYLAWFVVLVNLVAGLVFLWYSRKRKGNKAATDELAMADEPTIIGR